MDDREMLEWAAKAAGVPVVFDGHLPKMKVGGGKIGVWRNWNPLTDDGDALRLACSLGMILDLRYTDPMLQTCNSVKYWLRGMWHETYREIKLDANGDQLVATRRAIVRAAAAIGKEGK